MEHVLKLVHKKLESHARARLKSLEPRVSRLRRLLKPSGRLAALTRSLSMKTVTHAELELLTLPLALPVPVPLALLVPLPLPLPLPLPRSRTRSSSW